MIGKTISHYKIISKLGEGGMGVVYKAQDTKLDREVALKFLPISTITVKEEKMRFEQEAKAAAKLSHANIATVHAIEEVDGQAFIAMEYVDGETLSEKIDKGPLKLEEAINIATQIAEGLQAAHEKKITHRDIKSANIMLTAKGAVKIMDFGLAKLSGRSMVTKAGTTLGTASYMSPEQARGESADHRSDIWSLGVVLYEMISGQLPFKGDYEQAVVYGILNEDPEPLTALRSGIPLALDGIIAKALARDIKTRYQHVDEMPADLKALETDSLSRSRISTGAQPLKGIGQFNGSPLPWIITALSVISLIVTLIFFAGDETTQETMRINLSALTSQNQSLVRTDIGALALSPDGSTLAYTLNESGQNQLYLRRLDDFVAVPVNGTNNARAPFFSQDGQWIGFHADGKIKRVALSGGVVETICDSPGFRGASWGPDNTIVYSPEFNSGLMAVSAMGGPSRQISSLDSTQLERTHRWPQVLPDGKWVLFTIGDQNNPQSYVDARLAIQSLESGERHILNVRGEIARYVEPGFLIIGRNGTLFAAPFSLRELKTTQPLVPVLDNVDGDAGSGITYFTISKTGRLVYIPGIRNQDMELVWVDKQGAIEPLPLPSDAYSAPRLSPDGTRLSVVIGQRARQEYDISMYDLTTGAMRRFTFGNRIGSPVWSPDGKTMYFSSDGGAARGVFAKPADGSSAETLLRLTRDAPEFPVQISPDGQKLLINQLSGPSEGSILALDLSGQQDLDTLFSSDRYAYGGDYSHDGRFLTYGSNETGTLEIFVTSLPDLEGKWLVSSESGMNSLWSPDDKELYYISALGKMMAITISTDPVFSAGKPRELFDVSQMDFPNTPTSNYDISPDGKRFIMVRNTRETTRTQAFNVVLNWTNELRDKFKSGE